MVSDKENKEVEDMTTTELIDELDKTHGRNQDLLHDELNRREFVKSNYEWINDCLETLEKKVDGMQVAIDKLKRHKHDETGSPVVNL